MIAKSHNTYIDADTVVHPGPDADNRKAALPEQSKQTPVPTVKSQDTVSAGGISGLQPFVPLPLFSCSLALHTIKNLLWRDQAGTEHCATPGLFTELF